MKRNFLFFLIIHCLNLVSLNSKAQSDNDTILFNELGNFEFNFPYSGYTPLIDRLGRPYVYLAAKELGLVTFDISNTLNPVPVDTQTFVSLGNLKVTGVAQENNYLFVSLGDFQGSGQNAGLAIYDITDPIQPLLLDSWDSTAYDRGTSSVILQGDYAYLSAMAQGVLIMDVSDKENIQFVSQIIPDLLFGNQTHEYHARGLFINGDTLLVANDNGGLRVIDVADKQNPIETGKYISSPMSSVADPFYNHVYRIGDYAFLAVDYCGFEVVDVTNPSLMTSVSWLNPWSCTNLPAPFGSWNGSDGHTNEITRTSSENVLFFSGGDSEVLALDPSDPSQIRIMGAWGPANDSVGTWGIDTYQNLVVLANGRTFGFPFVSNVGGIQLLDWELVLETAEINKNDFEMNIFPNPASEYFILEVPDLKNELYQLEVRDLSGRIVYTAQINHSEMKVWTDQFKQGIYFICVKSDNKVLAVNKLMVEKG